MHNIILDIHIVSMSMSLILMVTALLFGAFGRSAAAFTATLSMIGSVIGGMSGIFLLLDAPLNLRCGLLASYLLAMTLIYIFGFAMGDARTARFIRGSRSVQ